MRFSILGRLVVADEDGRAVTLAAPRQRAVLAALLLNANRVVPKDSLAEMVWDGAPPAGAVATVRAYVMRLRKTLGGELAARIETHGPGYLIRIEPGELDAKQFEELYRLAEAAVRADSRWPEAAATAARALALWRGTPLIDVPSRSLRDAWVSCLEQQQVQLLEWRIEADLRLGRSDALIPEISSLLQEHPLREPLYRLQMLALAQAGRAGEALAVFRHARITLLEQLGVEPAAPLQRLHQQILCGEQPWTGTDTAVAQPAAAARPAEEPKRPRQLPGDIRSFVGRDGELARLLALAETAGQDAVCETVLVTAIDGMGGVGKSALAVRAAHRLSARFPDGQLFVDFRGHTSGLDELTVHEALDWLLRALDVSPERIPRGLAEGAALYRSRLAGTRTLILFDNVTSSAQIRPLLPAEPGCLVMVTSRSMLAGLDDAHLLHIDVLDRAAALDLARRIAGPGRLDPGDPALGELVDLCGRLPLAIRIAAAHLRHRRSLRVEDYVGQLRDAASRLELLRDEERSMTAVFDSSFDGLPSDERRLFLLLGLVPGPDTDAYAAASLLGCGLHEAERTLDSLLAHNLLLERGPGRYAFHDLARAYARDRAAHGRELSEPEADAAWERLLSYYLCAAAACDSVTLTTSASTRPRAYLADIQPTTPVPVIAGMSDGQAWLRAEQKNVVAAIADARTRGRHDLVTQLTAAITAGLRHDGPWPFTVQLHADAVESARTLGQPRDTAHHLVALGRAQQHVGDTPAALSSFEQAAGIAHDTGEASIEAKALYYLGRSRQMIDEDELAIAAHERARELYRAQQDALGEADVLTNLGRLMQSRGDMERSVEFQQRALELCSSVGYRFGEAGARWELGRTKARLGDYVGAVEALQETLAYYREAENALNEAHALWELGHVRLATGQREAAQAVFEEAFELFAARGYRFGETYLRWELGRVRLAAGRPREALVWLRQATAAFRGIGNHTGEANALHELARARLALDGPTTAGHLLDGALRLFLKVEDPQGAAEVYNSKGMLAAYHGDARQALDMHLDALQLARASGSLLDEARALDGAASARGRLGETGQALADLSEAVALYERMGVTEAHGARQRLGVLEGA